MSGPPSVRRLLALALLCACPSQLLAAPAATNSAAAVQILHPLTVQKKEDLDFGWISVTTAGTIAIDPLSEAVTTSGGVLRIGGTPHPALFTGAASGGAVVLVKLPKQPVTLTQVSGTETLTLSKFTMDGPDRRTMAKVGSFDFRVGGTLNVGANQADGTYVGTFTVTVQYP